MTITLIFINAAVWILEIFIEYSDYSLLETIFHLFGFVPDAILSQTGSGAIMAISSVFLHGSWWHIVGNMAFLWTFGRRVEDACGAWRFLAFYLTAGVLANLATVVVEQGSPIPHIGASGAISGVIGAHLLLFPGSRIRFLILISYLPLFPRIRAIWFILFWIAIQIPPALNILINDANYSIGYWAHLGGFFSAALVFLFLRPTAFQRYINDVPI
jgi:membrane associated rhomboid family serine protease